MGLGPGGNVPVRAEAARGEGREAEEADEGAGGQGGDGSSSQRPAHSFAHKEKNKAAVGNHHRKDRAFRKMGMM